MKNNKKLLVLSLLACTLLTGCDDVTKVQNGSDAVGKVTASGEELETILTLQDLYESLKETNGGSVVVDKLLEKIASIEYSDDALATTRPVEDGKFDVRNYRTTASLQKDIAKKFEDIVDGTSYLDDDGNFDPEAYKEYVSETLDYEVRDGQTSEKYIADSSLRAKLGYNYDEYIEKSIKPDILENYLYIDYITGISKYKGQFSNQYAVKLEVLKIEHDTTKLNGAWNESLVKDVKAVTSGNGVSAFGTDYSFVTFNSDLQMIVFTTSANELDYSVYTLTDNDVALYVPSHIAMNGKNPVKQLDLSKASDLTTVNGIISRSTKVDDKSWKITTSATADSTFYENIEDVLIARKLWNIDHEVTLAKNYDYKTTYYEAMTETEKSEAQGFASTYSNSNSKPLKEVAKQKKITAQQTKYYSKPDYYTKSTYTSVLPSTLSSLRGTSAKDLISHLQSFGASSNANDNQFLLPSNDSYKDPVYLDTSSNNYYICEVSDWYGYYQYVNLLDSSKPSKQISNYQIEAYQKGSYTTWKLNDEGTRFVEDTASTVVYSSHPEAFESIIELVQISANAILTDAMKKEAIVSLFEKYSLEINDQDIYDYISNQYPDYFEDEE
ncbi:MAG: hypothetical protein MR270_01100 [Erysipelotrichaceae bacterium]|nr:hypothetical protein [Erysipelotrichaceae bacterium]